MILQNIRTRAAADLQHIILPEGEDPRTVEAAAICAREAIAKITLIGSEEKIRETGANLNGVDILDHRKSPDFGKIASLYHELRRAKGVTLEEAEQTVKTRSTTATCWSSWPGRGSVAGATNTTAHTWPPL